MVDKVLECVQETAEDQAQADARMRSQLSEQELQQIAGILAECSGQLAGLMQQLVALDGFPEAADRIIRMQRDTEARIQAGFANLARFAEQFNRIEAGVGRIEATVGWIEKQIRQLAERNHVRGDEARKLTVSITNEKEREVLRKLRDEYRNLPPEQQNVESLTLLADSLSAAGQFSQAQEMHAEAARRAAAENKSLAAKNHYQRYRDACELGQWQEALDALLEAARLDPAYRPFSLVQYVPKMILGTGGFGTVLRCEDQYAIAEERAVAVKTLHTANLARAVREVFAEAHIIKTLNHPAIIGVRAWGCFDDDEARPFIVMEYFQGDSLAKHLRQHGKLEPGEAVAIARQVASGMNAAHKARVYHRDLKPDNILVRPKRVSGRGRCGSSTSAWPCASMQPARACCVRRTLALPATGVTPAPSSTPRRSRRTRRTPSAARSRKSARIPTSTPSARPSARLSSARRRRKAFTTTSCPRTISPCAICWSAAPLTPWKNVCGLR